MKDTLRKLVSGVLALALLFGTVSLVDMVSPRVARAVQPIFGESCPTIYVTTSDWLDFQGTGVASNINVMVNYRIKRAVDGKIFQDGFEVNAGSANGNGIRIPYDGCLITASAMIRQPGTIGGANFYGQLILLNGPLTGMGRATNNGASTAVSIPVANQNLLQAILFGGCMGSFYMYTYPTSGVSNPESCQGNPQSISIANPASVTNWQQALFIGWRHRIINIQYTLATSVTAGNRFACVQFLTGGVSGTVVGQACSNNPQQASQTVTYEFAAGIGSSPNCSLLGATQTPVQCAVVMVALPAYWETVSAADTFAINSAVTAGNGGSATSGFQTGDQISSISIRELMWNSTN